MFKLIKSGGKAVAVALAPLSLVAGSAHAALPEGVEAKLTSAGTDGAAVAAAVFLAILAIFAVKLFRKGL